MSPRNPNPRPAIEPKPQRAPKTPPKSASQRAQGAIKRGGVVRKPKFNELFRLPMGEAPKAKPKTLGEGVEDKFKITKAKKMSFNVRDTEGNLYDVFYNKTLNRTILKNQVDPVLFNEKGERIGYVGKKGEFVFADPPKGWKPNHPKKIEVDEMGKEMIAKKIPKPKILGEGIENKW